jgi:CrcB protein
LVGVLGGFTTFSAFGWETVALAGDGQFLRAFVYVILSNAGSLAAVWIGVRLAERFLGV